MHALATLSEENGAIRSQTDFHILQVCAPTGAGKTNIAMIAILHEVCSWYPSMFFPLQ